MYQITANGAFLGYTDSPEYCYKLPSGSPQVIGPVERGNGAVATGIIFQGVIYNLPEHNDFEGAETVYISDIDEGAIITQQSRDIAENKSSIGGQRVDRPYKVGEFITVDGKLYRVVLPILVGGFITPGTNVEETDIAAELSKLNLRGE